MKLLTLTSLLVALAITTGNAAAGSRCSTNYLGTTTCTTGPGYSTYGGTTYTGSTNYLGTTTWSGSNGSRTSCSTNYLGVTTCN